MRENLKPCPFCGSEEVIMEDGYGLFYVRCADCGASASYCETDEEAISAWNERVIVH